MNPKLHFLSPILQTKNIEQTISFYESVLGFKKKTQLPNFVSLTRDHVEIMFIQPAEEPKELKLTGDIYIFTEKVDELWDFLKEKTKRKTSIADRVYLMRDFSILDNNGYELVFGEDISSKNK